MADKVKIRILLRYYWKKGLNASKAARERNDLFFVVIMENKL
jgi:hypothetical protein